MSTVITYAGGAAINPDLALIDSGTLTAESGTVTHPILDGPPVHTVRTATPPAGEMHLLFTDERDALDAFEAHRSPAVFTVTSDDSRLLGVTRYVVGSERQPRIDLDRETADAWIVVVPFEAVHS